PFNDTGLSPGTSYSYRVRATDAAGNLSAYSNTATAVTLSGQPTQPVLVAEAHSATSGAGATSSSATLSLNVTGTDTLLVVAWHAEYDGNLPNSWTVTSNGVPGTLLVETNGYTGGAGNRRVRIYYWLNPAPGATTIVVSNPYTGQNELAVSAVLFANVAQSSPLGAPVLDVSTTARTSESEVVPTISSDLVLHVIADQLFTRGTL